MAAWWSSLGAAESVFYIIAIASTFILIIQLALNLIGLAGHDVDLDSSAGADVPSDFSLDHPDGAGHSSGLGLISVRTVMAFFVGFGWAGVAALGSRIPLFMTVVIAVVVGCIFVLVVYALMKTIFRLSEAGNIDFRNAVGQTGTVYLPVPAKGRGTGQVQVVVQGRLRELRAVTDGDETLPAGTHIRVVDVVSESTMLVQKIEVK